MSCSFDYESALLARGVSRIAGIDEAGRGPLAGPVVAAAVVFSKTSAPAGLDDSKKLTPKARERIFQELMVTVEWSVGVVEAAEIDKINILRATHLAMRRAVEGLDAIDVALVDGLPVRGLPIPHEALVGGDALSFSIAAASVIAKVTRDRIMQEMDALYPHYGFSQHKGYATAVHLASLQAHGPCPIHRRSFSPVAQRAFL